MQLRSPKLPVENGVQFTRDEHGGPVLELEDASAKSGLDFAPGVERHDLPDATSDPAQRRGARDLELQKQVRISAEDDLLLDAVVVGPARAVGHVVSRARSGGPVWASRQMVNVNGFGVCNCASLAPTCSAPQLRCSAETLRVARARARAPHVPRYTSFTNVPMMRSQRSRIAPSTSPTYPNASATSKHASVSRADPSAV